MLHYAVFLAVISSEVWARNLVQSSQRGGISSSRTTSPIFALALKGSQYPFQLSQAISSQKISVVLGNVSVRSHEGSCPAADLRGTFWEQAPLQHPPILVNARSFLQKHLRAPGVVVPRRGHGGCIICLGTRGLEAVLGALMLFPLFPWGRQGWQEGSHVSWGHRGIPQGTSSTEASLAVASAPLFMHCPLTPIFGGWHG